MRVQRGKLIVPARGGICQRAAPVTHVILRPRGGCALADASPADFLLIYFTVSKVLTISGTVS
jgi:hypothetical protein